MYTCQTLILRIILAIGTDSSFSRKQSNQFFQLCVYTMGTLKKICISFFWFPYSVFFMFMKNHLPHGRAVHFSNLMTGTQLSRTYGPPEEESATSSSTQSEKLLWVALGLQAITLNESKLHSLLHRSMSPTSSCEYALKHNKKNG